MRKLLFTRTAQRDLAALPAEVREAMIALLIAYAAGEAVDALEMRGRPEMRLKAGEYRAIVSRTRATVEVRRVRHRSIVYRP